MRETRAQFSDYMPSLVVDLANVPDRQGGSIGLKVMQRLNFRYIKMFLELIDDKLTYVENNVNKTNLFHCILSNRQL